MAVNIESGKNFCGLFNQPRHVCIDVAALDSLPGTEMNNGMAEILKYAFIRDRELFEFLSDKTDSMLSKDHETLSCCVARCCRIKADVVQADEREGGVRMILNYGHTVGHAIEAASNYKPRTRAVCGLAACASSPDLPNASVCFQPPSAICTTTCWTATGWPLRR